MKRRKRLILLTTLPPATLVLLLVVYNLAAMTLVARYVRGAERDADGRCLPGAAARTLGPEGAEVGVLLIHGFIGDGTNFGDLPNRFAEEGYRVRVTLLPGHGTDPREFRLVSPEDMQTHVAQEIAKLRDEGCREVVLVGHSMGGTLATLAAAEGHADRLVLVAPYFGVPHRWYYGLKTKQWTALLGPVVRWIPNPVCLRGVNQNEAKQYIQTYRWSPIEGVRTLMALGEEANAPEVAEGVHCPTLWLHAPEDRAADYECARKVVEGFASEAVTSRLYPQSSHVLFFDYDAEKAMEDIVAWLAET